MRLIENIILFTIIIFLLKSCSSQADQDTLSYDLFNTYINEIGSQCDLGKCQNIKFIVIPLYEGCNSCRQEIIKYLNENDNLIKKENLTIILLQGRAGIQEVNSVKKTLARYTFLIDENMEFVRYSFGQTGKFYIIHLITGKTTIIELTTDNLSEHLPKLHE